MTSRPRYTTDEQRLQARADNSRRYRDKQKLQATRTTPLPLEEKLSFIENRYRNQVDLLDALGNRVAELELQVRQLTESSITVEELSAFRAQVVEEFKRTSSSTKALPPRSAT